VFKTTLEQFLGDLQAHMCLGAGDTACGTRSANTACSASWLAGCQQQVFGAVTRQSHSHCGSSIVRQ
jgi:hypothetical protein